MNLDFKTEILYTPALVRLWNLFDGGSKLVIFWVKNQHIQRKSLYVYLPYV